MTFSLLPPVRDVPISATTNGNVSPPWLKKIEDATDIRRNILIAFERGETGAEPQERRRPLNFVVTGGGPTGVELAGAIVELARKALATDFRNIDPHQARVTLIEANPRLLNAFPETLSKPAKDALEHLGVEVRLGMAATVCDEHSVVIAGERIEATIIWAARVAASSAAKWLGAEKDRVGRGIVGEDLTLAWLLWGDVHVLFLLGFRNRVAVLFNWLWANFTFERGSRLITTSAAEE
jgi:NADH dehydrogenase